MDIEFFKHLIGQQLCDIVPAYGQYTTKLT